MKSYEDIAKEVDTIVDGLGDPVDANIKKAVIALRMAGLQTSASCEGHTGEGLPYPWIEIYAPEQDELSWKKANEIERQKVASLLQEFYSQHESECPLILEYIGVYGGFRIQSVPRDQKAKLGNLSTYRKEMNLFADFIFNKLKSK